MLDEYVDSCLFEQRLTSVGLHPLDYLLVYFLLLNLGELPRNTFFIQYIEPRVFQSAQCINSLGRVHNYHLANQVLAFLAESRRHLEGTLLDLPKYFLLA